MPSMYQLAVPLLLGRMKVLSMLLKKGDAFAKEKGFDPEVLIQSRLAPDMFPLLRQVQIATDMAKSAAARLTGAENPPFADNETSLAELQQRIARVITFLKGFKAAQFDAAESRAVTLQLRSGSMEFNGQDYLLNWVLPNVYFHVTTCYNILRHNGVPLGKADYLAMATPKPAKAKARKAKK